eukprot:3387539-Amphidinium_carterae.1
MRVQAVRGERSAPMHRHYAFELGDMTIVCYDCGLCLAQAANKLRAICGPISLNGQITWSHISQDLNSGRMACGRAGYLESDRLVETFEHGHCAFRRCNVESTCFPTLD